MTADDRTARLNDIEARANAATVATGTPIAHDVLWLVERVRTLTAEVEEWRAIRLCSDHHDGPDGVDHGSPTCVLCMINRAEAAEAEVERMDGRRRAAWAEANDALSRAEAAEAENELLRRRWEIAWDYAAQEFMSAVSALFRAEAAEARVRELEATVQRVREVVGRSQMFPSVKAGIIAALGPVQPDDEEAAREADLDAKFEVHQERLARERDEREET